MEINPRFAIIRYSALGDLILCSAAINTLAMQLPHSHITWITHPTVASLCNIPPNVTLAAQHKPKKLKDYLHFRNCYKDNVFDAALLMQASLRINALFPLITAHQKIGFDRQRARDGQALFATHKIPYQEGHLLDGFYQFIARLFELNPDLTQLSIQNTTQPKWSIHLDPTEVQWVTQMLDSSHHWIAIAPCASNPERNWPLERMQTLITTLLKDGHNIRIVLIGGHSDSEKTIGNQLSHSHPAPLRRRILNIIGSTHLPRLSAILQHCKLLIAPDTGPVHLARALNTPVVGLYAVARPELTGPYQALDFCINAYPSAVETYLKKSVEEVSWHTRVHHPDAMSLISLSQVCEQIDKAMKGVFT